MTRAQFCKEIAERSGISKETVAAVIAEEENLVYEIMATCDSIRYIWGTVSGIEKAPRRVGGMYRELDAIKKNSGWSNWKQGYPQIKWTKVAKVCDSRPPAEYFEQPEKRYTSMARTFRKEAGLPEIPEYEGLSEEKILEICKKADEVELNSLTVEQRFNKERDKKYNAQKKLAMIDYWEKTGYIPQGVVYDEELGDLNYSGKQKDTIDHYLETRLADAQTLPEKLDVVLTCQDMAEYKNIVEAHPELQELENQFREEIEKQGLKPLRHVKKKYAEGRFTLKYNGEDDPWGFNKNTFTPPPDEREEERKRQMELIGEELKENS